MIVVFPSTIVEPAETSFAINVSSTPFLPSAIVQRIQALPNNAPFRSLVWIAMYASAILATKN